MIKKFWRVVRFFLLLTGIIILFFSYFQERDSRIRLLPTQGELDSVLPGAVLKDRKEKPIPHYPGKIIVDGKPRRAVALLSAELEPKVAGFTDQLNILFSMDEDGRIYKLRIISHRETPYYFRLIRESGFLDKIIGTKISELDELKAVSGATISSKAILQDLKTSGEKALREIFKKEILETRSVSLGRIYLQPEIIFLVFILLMGLVERFWRNRWMRWLVFGLSIGVIGFWLKTPFALPHLFQILSLQVPFRSNFYLVVLGGFVFLTTLLWGPLWCAYLCPYAGLQELVSHWGKKFRWHPSAYTLEWASQLRWLVLFGAVFFYFGLKLRSGAELEPFFHLFSAKWTLSGIMLVLFTLLGSFFLPRFWCRFFCPTGACLLLLSSHRKIFRAIERGISESGIESSPSRSEQN